jgi:hypothetical protein
MAPDQAAEPLAELEDGGGDRVLAEPVPTSSRDTFAPGLDERISGRRERKLVDHEQRERLALDVDALPERGGGEQNRVDLVSELLEQPLARGISLAQNRVGKPGADELDQRIEGAVRRRQDQGTPA